MWNFRLGLLCPVPDLEISQHGGPLRMLEFRYVGVWGLGFKDVLYIYIYMYKVFGFKDVLYVYIYIYM